MSETYAAAAVRRASRLRPHGLRRIVGDCRQRFPASAPVRLAIASRLWCYGFDIDNEVWGIMRGTIDPLVKGLSAADGAAALTGRWLVVRRERGLGTPIARLTRSPAGEGLALDLGAVATEALERLAA